MKVWSVFLFILFWPAPTHIELTKSATKKIEKLLQEKYPDQLISYRYEEISATESFELKDLYSLHDIHSLKGYMVVSSAKGRYDYFDYCVIYNLETVLTGIEILVYRSDHGFEICNKRWLSQFIGMKAGELKTYGRDVDAISGATFSGNSITKDINQISSSISQVIRTQK